MNGAVNLENAIEYLEAIPMGHLFVRTENKCPYRKCNLSISDDLVMTKCDLVNVSLECHRIRIGDVGITQFIKRVIGLPGVMDYVLRQHVREAHGKGVRYLRQMRFSLSDSSGWSADPYETE